MVMAISQNWIEVEGYGRCWQPTVVVGNRNWQPYCDRGQWVYSDAGWYWLSDYTWGATTFHYGRWFTHPSRGCSMPQLRASGGAGMFYCFAAK